MDKIVDHLFVFKGDGTFDDFPGNYSDYRVYEKVKPKEVAQIVEKAIDVKSNKKEKTSGGKLSYQEQQEYKQLEKDIQKLEKQKKVLENAFSNPELSGDEINAKSIELKEISDKLNLKTERWFELSMILEG